MRHRASSVRRIAVGCAILLASVTLAPPAAAQLPSRADSVRLVERMTTLHRARSANDAAGWYALLSPAIREVMTLDDFKADFRIAGGPGEPPPGLRVTLARVCGCQAVQEPWGATRCVALTDLRADEPPGAAARWIESWDLIGKEWYWIYGQPVPGGPGEPPRCPGER